MAKREPYLQHLSLARHLVSSFEEFPYCIPAIKHLDRLELHPKVTFFIGENGSGKSTLLEGLAVLENFHPAGGTRNFNYQSRETDKENPLKWTLQVSRGPMGKLRRDGYFFRAESFYNTATYIEEIANGLYGDKSLHAMSHGESFLTLFTTRLTGGGLYLFDEPEAALSPQRQLTFLAAMHQWIENEAQLVIATHSPIIMAYPDAYLYLFDEQGIRRVEYKETEHYRVTHTFLNRTEQMLADLMSAD